MTVQQQEDYMSDEEQQVNETATTTTTTTPDVEIDEGMVDVNGKKKLYKKILKEGSGDATPDKHCNVVVHYVGTLKKDGSKFDSSRDRNEPFQFKLGESAVIKGWDVGVATMKKGEVAQFLIHPEYAYGKAGSGKNIPPNSWLVFEVELIRWELPDISKDKDRSLLQRIVKQGDGWETPNDGTKCKINYKISLRDRNEPLESANSQIVDSREGVDIVVGDEQIVSFIERGIEKMKLSGRSVFYAYPKSAIVEDLKYTIHSESERKAFENAQDKCYEVEVELLEMNKPEREWNMDPEKKITVATESKDEGNTLFKNGRLNLALKRYKRSLDVLSSDKKFSDDQKQQAKKLKLNAHTNIAVVEFKQKNYSEVINQANKALEIEADNVKALFKRAQANFAKGDSEVAKTDLEKCLEIEPDNQPVKVELNKVLKKLKEDYEQSKQLYSRMFQ